MRVEKFSCFDKICLSNSRRLVWIVFSRCLTFFIPDFILYYVGGMKSPAFRNAWREKIAILFLFLLSAGFFCVWLEFISSYFCDPEKTYDYSEVFANDSKMAAINGKAVDWKHVNPSSSIQTMVDWVNQYPHHDLSHNFPTFMVLDRPSDKAFYADSVVNDCILSQNKAQEADAWLDFVLESNPGYTYQTVSNVKQLLQCPLPNQPNITGGPCFYGPDVDAELSTLPIKGDIEYDPNVIKLYNGLPSPDNSTKQAFVVLDGYVLDVTTYLTGATNIIPLSSTLSSRSFALNRMFLPLDLTMFLYINLGKDITDYFDGNVTGNPTLYRNCLIHLFKKGVVPTHIASDCRRINPALWATMGVGLIYFLIKMNLAQLFRAPFIQRRLLSYSLTPSTSAAAINSQKPQIDYRFSQSSYIRQQALPQWPYTLLLIPCFSESSETLKQTIDSVSRTTYDDRKKLLVFICDGVTTSAQEEVETHMLLLQYLGYSRTEEPLPQPYSSLGQHQRRINYARVYSGYYETGRNRVPYLVIVKVGQTQEQEQYQKEEQQQDQERPQQRRSMFCLGNGNKNSKLAVTKGRNIMAPPGNRGKRDSLLIIFGFLERCSNLADNLITPLDYELFNQCYNVLGMDPRLFRYVMVTDADIQVQNDVVQRLVLRLEQDPKMLAVSGHVRPANPEENLTTMLQIFPVYMTYFSGLAFEACLNSVTTLNGGLVMYKVWKEANFCCAFENGPKQISGNFWGKFKIFQPDYRNSTSIPIARVTDSRIVDKWPTKTSDEIIITNPFQDPVESTKSRKISSSTTDDDESFTTITTATTTAAVTDKRSQLHFRQHQYVNHQIAGSHRPTSREQKHPLIDIAAAAQGYCPDSHLSLSRNIYRQLCCVHPTVLRALSVPQANTMHMSNVLLLGEDKILSLLLLKAHPHHRLGFEHEAIGYTTLPTRFFSLQGHQVRHIRATFHIQLEFQRAAWQLGFTYWLLSTTELLDTIFSMPIIVYLYGVFGRALRHYGMAYVIIACSFTGLVILHLMFFMLRRQFRYICWFILYCLLSLPLYAVWFPLLAIWQSNYGEYWYDVWPRSNKYQRKRLHGIIDPAAALQTKELYDNLDTKRTRDNEGGQNERRRRPYDENFSNEKYMQEAAAAAIVKTATLSVPRMRLTDYELLETRRIYQAAEAAFDSNFVGFSRAAIDADLTQQQQQQQQNMSNTNDTIEGASVIISPPTIAQIRDGVHATRITTHQHPYEVDMYNNNTLDSPSSWKNHEYNVQQRNNPFLDPYNPFDTHSQHSEPSSSNRNNLRLPTTHCNASYHHRPSNSQSSYLTSISQHNRNLSMTSTSLSTAVARYNNNADLVLDGSTLPASSLSSSGFIKLLPTTSTSPYLTPISFTTNTPKEEIISMDNLSTEQLDLSSTAPPPLILEEKEEAPIAARGGLREIEADRASTLSITSNTFSIYTPENLICEDNPLDQDDEDRYPRHRIMMTHQNHHMAAKNNNDHSRLAGKKR